MSKTLCDWSKRDIEDEIDKLRALTKHPTYFCRKCARVANTPKVLCKPQGFRPSSSSSREDGR